MFSEPKLEELNKRQSDVDLCIKCGYCTFWCPLYQEDPIETSAARGKIETVRKLLAGQQYLDDQSLADINRCLLCGTCSEHCLKKVPTPSIVLAIRADRVKARGLKFPYSLIYQRLVPHRTLFGNSVRLASWFQGVFLPKTEGTTRHLPFFLSALGQGRHIPSIAPRFLRQMVPVVNKPPEDIPTRMKVGFFIGCLNDFVFPHVAKHTIDFLTRNGIEVIVPRKQGCCGAPVYLGAGNFATGRKLADANVSAFKGIDYIVSSCATCTSAIKDYVKYLADTPERKEAYQHLASRTKDITEFLVDVLKLPLSRYKTASGVKGRKVTYHDSCHLNRYLGITRQPRQIIKALPEIEFIEMVRPDWCCGMGGAFSLNYYDLSQKIADKKMQAIRESGADIVVAGCPGCQIQMIDNSLRCGLPVKVMHIMELLE
jgi:glycolate oxidase iron-sulfur subunit